jgi:hypothetical protein
VKGPAQLATQLGAALVAVGFAVIGLAWNGAASSNSLPAQMPYLLSGGIPGLGMIVLGGTVLLVQLQRRLTAERGRQMAALQEGVASLAAALGTPETAWAPPVTGARSELPPAAVEIFVAGRDGASTGPSTGVPVLGRLANANGDDVTLPLPAPLADNGDVDAVFRPPSADSVQGPIAAGHGATAAAHGPPPAAHGSDPGPAKPRGRVVVGRSSYHRPDCRVVAGRDDLPRRTAAQAVAAGLQPCRVCQPG